MSKFIVPPGINGAVIFQRQSMARARSDLSNSREIFRHMNLAECVVAPFGNGSIHLQRDSEGLGSLSHLWRALADFETADSSNIFRNIEKRGFFGSEFSASRKC